MTAPAQTAYINPDIHDATGALRCAEGSAIFVIATRRQIERLRVTIQRELGNVPIVQHVIRFEGRIAAADADIGAADAAIVSAEANVANARTEMERQDGLLKEGATSRQVVDNLRTVLKVQEAALGQARERRRRRRRAGRSRLT